MDALLPLDMDLVGVWVAFVLTLVVYSYLLGDNRLFRSLFRLAEHLFVGSAVAYAVVVAYHSVLYPRLIAPLSSDALGNWIALIPLVLGLLLLFKAKTSWSWLGNISMAYLFGVGAALAIGGALFGSLWPQVRATLLPVNAPGDWLTGVNHLLLIVGTIGALLYFRFESTPSEGVVGRLWGGFLKVWAQVGRLVILIAFGVIFATTLGARLALLIGRLQFLLGVLGL